MDSFNTNMRIIKGGADSKSGVSNDSDVTKVNNRVLKVDEPKFNHTLIFTEAERKDFRKIYATKNAFVMFSPDGVVRFLNNDSFSKLKTGNIVKVVLIFITIKKI